MTEKDALRILRPPLRFGDEGQIQAHRFLNRVQEVCEFIESCSECPECEGEGDEREKCTWCGGTCYDSDGSECFECRATGYISDRCGRCHGTGHSWCAADFGEQWPGSEVMSAAVDRLSNQLAALHRR